ncbi:hypothetical protein MU1_11630 [Paenibacillus glycanilyticus]|uniref:Uncharacterized protein n=1 Tax=Paenibacillus glycanilyticus TaxID=126569 RepID=A0ABQ6G762_9BACL|nr:hypothetical protein MU1_11630 [Paenibacillus glycanilyticus]
MSATGKYLNITPNIPNNTPRPVNPYILRWEMQLTLEQELRGSRNGTKQDHVVCFNGAAAVVHRISGLCGGSGQRSSQLR